MSDIDALDKLISEEAPETLIHFGFFDGIESLIEDVKTRIFRGHVPPTPAPIVRKGFGNKSGLRHREIIAEIGATDPAHLRKLNPNWRRRIAQKLGIPTNLIDFLLSDRRDEIAERELKGHVFEHQQRCADIEESLMAKRREAWGDRFEESPAYARTVATIDAEIDRIGGRDIERTYVERLVEFAHDLIGAIPKSDISIMHLADFDDDELAKEAKQRAERHRFYLSSLGHYARDEHLRRVAISTYLFFDSALSCHSSDAIVRQPVNLSQFCGVSINATQPAEHICEASEMLRMFGYMMRNACLDISFRSEWVFHTCAMQPERQRTPQERRRACERWQKRTLRRRLCRLHIALASLLEKTGTRAGSKYLDRESLRIYRRTKARCAQWAAETRVINKRTGEDVGSIEELKSKALNANIASTYAMLKGMEEWSIDAGFTALFVTLTLPSEWHPLSANERRQTPWNGEPLKAACDEIQRRWAAFRTYADRELVPLLGAQFREPHQDGCPHIHALFFVPTDRVEALKQCIQQSFGDRETYDEIDDDPAIDVKEIDRARGSARNYVLKYIMKCFDDSSYAPDIEGDQPPEDHLENKDAVRGWASMLGIRQFSFFGMNGSRTVWKSVYNASDADIESSPQIAAAHECMHALEPRYDLALVELGFLPRVDGGAATEAPEIEYEERLTMYGDAYKIPRFINFVDGYRIDLKVNEYELISVTVNANDPRDAGASPPPPSMTRSPPDTT